jgi:hypothetical protein
VQSEQPLSKLALVSARSSLVHLWRRPKHALLAAYLVNPLIAVLFSFGGEGTFAQYVSSFLATLWILSVPFFASEFRAQGNIAGAIVAAYPAIALGIVVCEGIAIIASGRIDGAAIVLFRITGMLCILPFITALALIPVLREGCRAPSTVLGCGKSHRAIEGGE